MEDKKRSNHCLTRDVQSVGLSPSSHAPLDLESTSISTHFLYPLEMARPCFAVENQLPMRRTYVASSYGLSRIHTLWT